MRAPPITITCDCSHIGYVRMGDRWTCEDCDRVWDTAQIPQEDYDAMLRRVRRYSILTIGPPLVLAAVLVPLAVFVDIAYGFVLFVLVMAYGLLVLPHIRSRARQRVLDAAPRWKLRPE